jgi:hypothetical protein
LEPIIWVNQPKHSLIGIRELLNETLFDKNSIHISGKNSTAIDGRGLESFKFIKICMFAIIVNKF